MTIIGSRADSYGEFDSALLRFRFDVCGLLPIVSLRITDRIMPPSRTRVRHGPGDSSGTAQQDALVDSRGRDRKSVV